MTNFEKIWSVLVSSGPMCDDCLSSSSSVRPRQSVNIMCRKLENTGDLTRRKDLCPKCRGTKIINAARNDLSDVPRIPKLPKTPSSANQKIVSAEYSEGEISTEEIKSILVTFATRIKEGEIEIYNEFSLQHELGLFLRDMTKKRLVQFERNVSFFGFSKRHFEKREIDIVVYRKHQALLDAAIELKFPRNGQHPEQMFSFCKDIVFAEQLKQAGFNKAYVVIFAEDRLFYEGSQNGIYGFFRQGRNLTGIVKKPTGKQGSELVIKGDYNIKWNDISGSLKYTLIEAQ